MTKNVSLLEFARLLDDEARLKDAKNVALETAAQMVEDEAKRVIGTYDFDWPQLAASTQDQRRSLGYAANEPLLRTGALRDSISHEIVAPGEEAVIGSTSDVAVWQEFGTATIPPRPFLMPALFYMEKPIKKAIGEIVGRAIAGARIDGAVIELLSDLAKHSVEIAKDIANSDDDDWR